MKQTSFPYVTGEVPYQPRTGILKDTMSDKALLFGAAAALSSLVLCSSALAYRHFEYRSLLESRAAAAQTSAASPEAPAVLSLPDTVPIPADGSEGGGKVAEAASKEDTVSTETESDEAIPETEITENETSPQDEAVTSPATETSPDASFPEGSREERNTVGGEASAETLPPLPEIQYASFSYNDYNVLLDTSIGTMMYYNQHDSHWGSYLYGGKDPMTSYGCGPTTAAMLVNAFGNVRGVITPVEMADWSANYGYYAPHSGSYHDYIPAVLSAFDLMVDSVQDRSVENVSSLLSSGHVLVALMGRGALTNGGHFIIITKRNPNGTVRIADPNSFENSSKEWSLGQLMNELKKNYDAGGPLWSVRPLSP